MKLPALKRSQVKAIQYLLSDADHNRHGIKTYSGKVDGDAGPATRKAWRKARWLLGYPQESYRLPATVARWPFMRSLLLPMKQDGKHNKEANELPKAFKARMRKRAKAKPRPSGGGEAVVVWARGQVGVMESPVGSNSGGTATRGVRWFQASTWLGGSGWPWCAAFVVRGWSEVFGFVPRRTAGAWDLTDNGGERVSVGNIRGGDAVSYAVGSGHVNLAIGQPVGGRIPTVGGNESQGVRLSSWPTSLVHSAARHPAA